MRSKRVLAFVVALCCCATLSGCNDNEELAELRNIEALNAESELISVNMSASEKEAAVYAQVSNRTLLDLSTLAPVEDSDKDAIITYMESVDAQLCGTLLASDGVIDTCYTDYLLMEFEKTPYYWQRSSMNIRGMDTTSRSIVVDVTYKTIDFKKDVQSASTIVKGEPDYETKLKVRYSRWLAVLESLYRYSQEKPEAQAMKQEFEANYGKIEDILDSQRDISLTSRVYETGNQKTYTGLVDHEQEKGGATMVVRYVLVPNYTLGINQGYTCQHMYVLSYALDNDMTEGRTLYNEEDCAVVADNVYSALIRYYKCLDESNFTGLYGLVDSFADLDKYYEDYFDTSYRKHDSFTLSIFDIRGTTIECGVTLSRKVRAKGSNMSLPIYTDRYYYVFELIDDKLMIKQEILLSSMLEGEPAISTNTVDTTGFTSSISLTNDDKKDIENLIANFGAQQLLADSSSDTFADLVDMSLSNSQLSTLKSNMLSVHGKTKATWIISYLQGQQNYASVKCRELVQTEDNKIVELVVTYDFIYKGGSWIIYDYKVLSRVTLDTTDLTTKNALCIVSPNSVDSLVSQVNGGGTVEETGDLVDNSFGESIDYKEYKPALKSGKVTKDNTTELQSGTEVTASDTSNIDITDVTSETTTVSLS